MKPNQDRRLSKEDFFHIGLEGLVKSGPQALKAVRLARILGVTTGSFYWHFEGLADFRSGLVEYWKESVIGGLIREATAGAEDPSQALAELGKLIRESGAHRYDTAMRDWARTDPLVRETVRDVDELRGAFLVEMLRKTGMGEDDARDRVNLIGAAWRGSQALPDPDYRMKLINIAASE